MIKGANPMLTASGNSEVKNHVIIFYTKSHISNKVFLAPVISP